MQEFILIYFIVWVVDNHNHHTDWVEVVLVAQAGEACVHQVVVADIVDILVLLAVEDNFGEDTADVHSVDLLVVDEEYKSTIQNIYFSIMDV